MFSINIQLTKSGKENVDKVIEAVFAFLGMLRRCKPEERIFNEAKQIKSLGFEYGAEPQPSDNVENLAGIGIWRPVPRKFTLSSKLHLASVCLGLRTWIHKGVFETLFLQNPCKCTLLRCT